MKKKRILLAWVMLALVLVSLNLVLADDNLTKSYTCLRQKISDQGGYSSLTNEEKAFSLLALSSNATEQLLLQSSVLSSLQSGCLSAGVGATGSCSLKITGMGILALTLTGGDTSQLESWLNSQTNVDQNTEWYLEIDSGVASCRIYSGNDDQGTITIGADKKISGSLTGNCFSQNFGGPFDGYWLKINPSCYTPNITTICNQTFVTSLIYKKSDSNVYYIPNTAKSASAGGRTDEKVNAFCFGTTCSDYEGSLWAATALKQKNIDVEKYKPYLYTSAQNNQALLPSAFLFKISNSATQAYYRSELVLKRAPIGNYWQPSSEKPEERNYYTSLAVWVLGKDTTDASAARDYLINDQLKASSDGCLAGSIRDTAFALFAVSGSSYAPVIPVNITIINPNQTTVLNTPYSTINIRINTAGSATDCNYNIDNGNLGNLSWLSGTIWTGSVNISTSSYFSQHSIIVSCKNIAGQEKTASKDFNVSIVPINISITKPKSGDSAITTQTTTVIAEINTESRACAFSFDDNSKRYNMTTTSYHSWSGQGVIPVSGFPDRGKHIVHVYCIDTLGNEINKQEEFSVNIEIPEPPTNGTVGITIDSPLNNARYDRLSILQSVNLTTTGAVDFCTCSLNSGSAISMTVMNASNPIKWSAPLNITFEGNHNLTAICTDTNGNSAQKIISFIFNTTATTQTSCTGQGYYCLSSNDCLTKTDNGEKLNGFTCYSATKICCSEAIISTPVLTTCYDKGGITCEDDEECEGTFVLSASDTSNCCKGTCRKVGVTTSCASKSGACKLSCNDDETSASYFCDSGDCCIPISSASEKSYWWVWVLLLLIILIALGIVFREKLKEVYFKITNKGKGPSGQGQQGRPPFGPGPGMPPVGMGMPRRIIPGMNRPGMMPPRGMPMRPNMPPARPFPKDKELNETLAKLKNMGK